MTTPEFTRTSLAIAFALAMLALGTLNPNASFGEVSCGLICEGAAATPAP